MKKYSFTDPMYQATICYVIGGTVQDLIKYLRRKHGRKYEMWSWDSGFEWTEDSDTTDGYQFHINAPLGRGEIFYVWVAEPSEYLMFHETFHLVCDILSTRGVTFSYDSEEAYAYLGGWIYDKITACLKKEANKKKPIDGEKN